MSTSGSATWAYISDISSTRVIVAGTGTGSAQTQNANNDARGNDSVALGQHCTASGDYSLADGSGCTATTTCSVALGNAADASGTCGFMYKDTCGNEFCFDSGGGDGSGNIQINGHIVAGVGDASHAPLGTSLFVEYAVAPTHSSGGGLTQLKNTTLPDGTKLGLPHDARSVSVTAWHMGSGYACGGGVTFNIPSSTLRNWWWGIVGTGASVYEMRLWSIPTTDDGNNDAKGFTWTGNDTPRQPDVPTPQHRGPRLGGCLLGPGGRERGRRGRERRIRGRRARHDSWSCQQHRRAPPRRRPRRRQRQHRRN